MKKMKKKILIKTSILLFAFVAIHSQLFSQSLVENELTTNQVLVQKSNELSTRGALQTRRSISDTISLGLKGILDDFSYDSPYPDTSIWLDNFVFINRDFPKAPITLGVATFDGLNANGYPFDFQAGSGSTGPADYLTSKPINFSTVTVADSVYFSFYYQPHGLGNAPEVTDSLVLQFKEAGVSSPWKNVWSHKGQTLAANDSSWHLVMIPIKDAKYFKKGFQFRFKNYATLSGNVDHWHIDYVYLNKTRGKNDTIFDDISFVYNTPSLLKDYTAVPWRHYNASLMKTNYATTIRDNSNIFKYSSFGYKIYDKLGVQQGATYSGGSENILPFFPNGYMNYPAFTSPPLNGYTFPSLPDTFYTIESFIFTNPDFNRGNDTVRHKQKFDNYYAYDDGTAETSFGLSTLYGQFAEKFVITTADTLQAIDIYWNPVLKNVSQLYTFNLMVWADNGGKPGSVIFIDTTAKPIYNQTGYDKFTRHYLQKSKVRLTPGTYYFGLRQNTNEFLNIGVDRNINTQYKVFYNVTGSWVNSPFSGSLMLHPVFGSSSEFTGINNNYLAATTNSTTVFPNPAKDKLFIKGLSTYTNELITISIIDLYGRTIKEVIGQSVESIDVSELSNSIYILRITSKDFSYTNKFIISR